MKASFPPFASCFPPWSCCARPALICDRRATGAFVGCKNQTSLTAIVKQNSQVSQIAHSPFWWPFSPTFTDCHACLPHPTMPPWHADAIDFHVTHRFFATFFTEESNVSLVPRLLSFIRKWGRRQVPRPQSNQSRNSSRSVTPNSLAMARRSSSVMVCSTGLPLASTSM